MQFVKVLIIFSVFAVLVFCKSDDLLETEEGIIPPSLPKFFFFNLSSVNLKKF